MDSSGDKGIELRPLTVLLFPKAISPLEVKQYQIDEVGCADTQKIFKKHI
jgi:hypothetical protein